MANDGDITPLILLRHMQTMEGRLLEQIGAVRNDLSDFKQDVKRRFDALNTKVDRHHTILSMQINNINERLDDMEVGEIPKIKQRIGMR